MSITHEEAVKAAQAEAILDEIDPVRAAAKKKRDEQKKVAEKKRKDKKRKNKPKKSKMGKRRKRR